MHEPEPAAYPQTDTAEFRAVTIFCERIDSNIVKAEVQTRDKTPNTDGTLTLVDSRRLPIGKFEVQVKAIGNDRTSYSCPTSLVAYSRICFAPVLLVCVDVEGGNVYWKHIHHSMPEYKPEQQTFTIHFDQQADAITDSHQYIQMWKVIVQQYQALFKGAHTLRTEILHELSLSGIPSDLVGAFQLYVDTINTGLDSEFAVLKPVLFPNVWKFGVALFDHDNESVTFREYAVERCSNGPLLVQVPKGLKFDKEGDTARGATSISQFSIDGLNEGLATKTIGRSDLLRPELMAKDFLYEVYRTGFQNRLFRLGGKMLCEETIFAFTDRFGVAMGLQADSTLTLDDVAYGATAFLPAWYELALKKHGIAFDPNGNQQIPTLDGLFMGDYPHVGQVSQTEVIQAIQAGRVQSYPCLFFSHMYLRQLVESVETLRGMGIVTIQRPYKQCGDTPICVSSGHEHRELLEYNLRQIISNLFQEYWSFVEVNGLSRLLHGKFLNPSTAFAYFVDFDQWYEDSTRPKLTECRLRDSERCHPKAELYLGEPSGRNSTQGLSISINGKLFRTAYQGQKDVRFLLSERPLQEWIIDDLLRLDGETYNAAYDHLEALMSGVPPRMS